jgi:hypothetical protein
LLCMVLNVELAVVICCPDITVLWFWAAVSTGNDKGARGNPEFFSWFNKDAAILLIQPSCFVFFPLLF